MSAEETAPGSLAYTPTWAVAVVCFIIISISVFLENSIHHLMDWLKRRHKTMLCEALVRVKSQFMLLGFLSILLTVTQGSIQKICIPAELANKMLPCGSAGGLVGYAHDGNNRFSRLLLSEENNNNNAGGRGDEEAGPCSSKGKVSFITTEGVEQLQQFLFVLAATQTLYSVLTVALGRIKMRRWEIWEKETRSIDYKNNHDKNKRRFSRQTTFWKRHETCAETSLQLWIKCFFRQFFTSVAKTDYLTLRHGFIMTHLSEGQLNSFDFQKYIKHTLDEDFRTVISISPMMWFIVVVFMLVDIHGWHSYFWISFVPLTVVLTVGTKLEVIVANMTLRLKKQTNEIARVELSDDNFWFGQPSFLLDLMHLTLFMNAFEVSFFIWVMMEFGSNSCYHESTTTLIRMVMTLIVHFICSYITLPHYALVTQMGSSFKGEIFNEKIAKVFKQWHIQVRRARKMKQAECSAGKFEQPPPNTHPTTENRNIDTSLGGSSHKSEKLYEITEESDE